jgi:hypothetical protein
MTIYDLESKIKRMYQTINESIDENVFNHLHHITNPDTKQVIGFGFDGSRKNNDQENRVIHIVHAIASLKDHLKKKVARGQMVEDVINNCLALKLLVDIDNANKHGYPLTKRRRSGLDPQIKNIRSIWNIDAGGSIISKRKFSFFKNENGSPEMSATTSFERADGKIQITADITDIDGNFLMSFNDMVDEAVKEWEQIIENHII